MATSFCTVSDPSSWDNAYMIHKKGKSLTVGKYLVYRREGKEKGKGGKYLAPKEERD